MAEENVTPVEEGTSFLEEAPANKSSMRLFAFLLLLTLIGLLGYQTWKYYSLVEYFANNATKLDVGVFAAFKSGLILYDPIWVLIFLAAIFVPKYLQKIVELKLGK